VALEGIGGPDVVTLLIIEVAYLSSGAMFVLVSRMTQRMASY